MTQSLLRFVQYVKKGVCQLELQTLLSRLENPKGGPDQYTARCPAHEDKHNSLSIGTGQNGCILLHCHAGCDTGSILSSLQLRPSDLFAGPKKQSIPVTVRARGETNLQICNKSAPTGTLTTANERLYRYNDRYGALLYEVVRREGADGKQFVQRRRENGRYMYNLKGVTTELYHLDRLHQALPGGEAVVYVCEGEKDADRLCEVGLLATTAPMGAGKWKPRYTESLKGARQVILLPDNDLPGHRHALAAARSLAQANIPVVIADLRRVWNQLPSKGDVSDVLDALGPGVLAQLADKALSLAEFEAVAFSKDNVMKEKKAVPFESASDFLQTGFLTQIRQTCEGSPITTGFAALDRQLEGRMYPGLYVVGSVSGLGKTALCLQMAVHMAREGHPVLFFTLEMSRLEMVARSLARTLFLQNHCAASPSVGDILSQRVDPPLLSAAMEAFQQEAGRNLVFLEGGAEGSTAQDLADTAQAFAKQAGRPPVVFVDYLQIVRPPAGHLSDKQATDHSVATLKQLSRQLNMPVVAVSSFNRQSYVEEVSLSSFKESGSIEYTADFILGLQAGGILHKGCAELDDKKTARIVRAATLDAQKQHPRPIDAVTLKNRRGPAWASFSLDFYTKQHHFVEARG